MSSHATHYIPGYAGSIETAPTALQRLAVVLVWLGVASGAVVFSEPAPVDLLTMGLIVGLPIVGLVTVPPALWIVAAVWALCGAGALVASTFAPDLERAVTHTAISIYLYAACIMFAAFVAKRPQQHTKLILDAYLWAAFGGAMAGVVGYFNLFPGAFELFTKYGRATGTFKDPNVLSTYIILPALLMTQDVMLGTRKWKLMRYLGLGIIVACLFLAFSRGAWVNFAGAVALMAIFTFILTPSKELRSRIVLLAIVGVVLMAVMLAGLLSIDVVKAAFEDRATLTKDYDSGEFGRFGNQINSIPILLESPFGFGPTKFRKIFTLDPHNVYLNGFSSYGWLGGIAYFMLVISTIIVGFKAMLIRSPWQGMAIALFCAFFATALQGVQIDTDHWRHFYWMLGLNWGLFAASAAYARHMALITAKG